MPVFPQVGGMELLILLIIILLFFGARRVPKVGRFLGRGMREFREEISGRTEMTSYVVSETRARGCLRRREGKPLPQQRRHAPGRSTGRSMPSRLPSRSLSRGIRCLA